MADRSNTDKAFQDARLLVRSCKEQLPLLEKGYRDAATARNVPAGLSIQTKNFLENLRSALDYIAQGLYEAAGIRRRAKVYYPYTNENATSRQFARILQDRMPGYSHARPDVAEVLKGLQHQTGNSFEWVPLFMALTNRRKHRNLGDHPVIKMRRLRISFKGHQVVRAPLIINDGEINIGGQRIPIGVYGPDNPPPVEAPIIAEAESIAAIVFADSSEVRVIPFLGKALEGVGFIVERLIEAESTRAPTPSAFT